MKKYKIQPGRYASEHLWSSRSNPARMAWVVFRRKLFKWEFYGAYPNQERAEEAIEELVAAQNLSPSFYNEKGERL